MVGSVKKLSISGTRDTLEITILSSQFAMNLKLLLKIKSIKRKTKKNCISPGLLTNYLISLWFYFFLYKNEG